MCATREVRVRGGLWWGEGLLVGGDGEEGAVGIVGKGGAVSDGRGCGRALGWGEMGWL